MSTNATAAEATTAAADLVGKIVKVTSAGKTVKLSDGSYGQKRASSLHMKVYKVAGGQAFGQIMHRASDGSGFVQYRDNTAMRSLRLDKFEVVG